MKSSPVLSSSSRQTLKEFRTKLELKLSQKKLSSKQKPQTPDCLKKSNFNLKHKSFTDYIDRSITPKKENSPRYNNYQYLSAFKNKIISPKICNKPNSELTKLSGHSSNFDFKNIQGNKTEKLSDFITLQSLEEATKIVTKGGIKSIDKIYATRLRAFCNEVLAKIRI